MQRTTLQRFAHRARRGFTLIELVVVVAVLVILAGLVLPKLDVFKLKANKGVAASNIAGVTRFVESYRIQKDLYPDRFDSLIETGVNTLYTDLDPQLTGLHVPGSPVKLTTTTIVGDELRSLTRMGIINVMDHTPGAGLPSNTGNVSRTLAPNSTVATLNWDAGAQTGEGDAADIIDTFYPENLIAGTGVHGATPAGKKIVIFGVGPSSQMIGSVLHTAPFYANSDQNAYYTRFLCAFEVDDGGSRARFLGTLGGDGDPIKDEIADFYEL